MIFLFRKHILFYCLIILCFGIETTLSQNNNVVVDHGIPIQSPNRISYKTAYHFGKNKINLLCWTTTAESGGHFFALNLNTKKLSVHPLNHLEAYPIVFGSNGKVYIGSTSGYIMVWNPDDDSWKEAGDRLFAVPGLSINHVRALCEGPDGWLYGGSCYGERARMNMQSGIVEHLPKFSEKGDWYISSVAMLPDGRIAFGTGYKARIIIYDPKKKKDVAQWIPEQYKNDGFCFNILSGKNIIYATHFPSGHRLCFDAVSGKFLGKIPWPDHQMDNLWSNWNHSSGYGSAVDFYVNPINEAAFTNSGDTIFQFHPLSKSLTKNFNISALSVTPELDLALQYEVTNDCRVIRYDYKEKKIIEQLTPELPTVERNIFSLTAGPDKKIYGGAYQSTLLFQFDPQKNITTVLGDHHPGWSGETYSYVNKGEELLCASYTNGALVAYNPFKNWDCLPGEMNNPRLIGFFGQLVYRPLDICLDKFDNVWAVGPAGWGTNGGGIAKISFQNFKTQSHNFNDIPHSIISLNSSMLVFCSDSIIRWWDVVYDTLIAELTIATPIRSLCQLIENSDTLVFLAERNSIKKVDMSKPGHINILSETHTPISISRIIPNKDEIIFGGSEGIGVLKLKDSIIVKLTPTPLGNRYAFTAIDSTIYFSNKGHLLSIKTTL